MHFEVILSNNASKSFAHTYCNKLTTEDELSTENLAIVSGNKRIE